MTKKLVLKGLLLLNKTKYINFLLFLNLLLLGCQTTQLSYINEENSVNENYYTYKNTNIWYEDIGEGKTFLFIHGFASSSYTWRHLKEYYSKTSRVICIDLKGFGQSGKPMDMSYTLEDQTDMILSFINDKDLKNVTLVGHSYGGAVALSTYITASKKMKDVMENLILIDSAAYKQDIPIYISLLRTPILNNITLGVLPNNTSSETMLKGLMYDDSKITREMVETYGGYLKGPNAHHAIIETANTIVPHNIEFLCSLYKDIPIPVLIIWGDQDTIVSRSIGERLHKDITGSTFSTINKCGHIPQEEFPNKTIGIIDDFMYKDIT